jgi:4-hydroxy-tetrahydrodipicolinate reductase
MSDLRIAIVGDGKMGRAIAALAPERNIEVVTTVAAAENASGRALTRERLGQADVIIEFTEPSAAPDNVIAALRAGYAVVCGTTGWADRFDEAAQVADDTGTALVCAPNFSVGVNLFLAAAAAAAHVMRVAPEFDRTSSKRITPRRRTRRPAPQTRSSERSAAGSVGMCRSPVCVPGTCRGRTS